MIQVSVVVPTFRRPDLLEKCIRALCAQSVDPDAFEIIICDDENSIHTFQLIIELKDQFPEHHLSYVYVRRNHGPAAARNRGWNKARGNIVAFTDDDCLPHTDWLKNALQSFANEKVDAIWGKVIVPLPENPTDFERNLAGLSKEEFVTANCFCRKSRLERIGGFDERFSRAWREDSDLFFSLIESAAEVKFVPEVTVLHPVRRARWGISILMQENNFFEPLLYKKHTWLYRQFASFPIIRMFYGMVVCFIVFLCSLLGRHWALAIVSGGIWLFLTGSFISRRLKDTSHKLDHILEMVWTSVMIPFMAVYWRVAGAVHFRVLFI